MPGRKPKPRSLREVTGNPGKRPLPPDVDLPDTGDAVMPPYLEKRPRAVELWNEYAPALVLLGTLKKESQALFAKWCWLEQAWEEAPDATKASMIANWRALASSLGMDPSNQGKFATPRGAKNDPLDKFFGPKAVND